jgi:signal transduction histidine kinase
MESLFDRFARGWAKASPIPGTGLGLSLVRDLLATYEGDILASSTLEQGSIFTFWIPNVSAAAQP